MTRAELLEKMEREVATRSVAGLYCSYRIPETEGRIRASFFGVYEAHGRKVHKEAPFQVSGGADVATTISEAFTALLNAKKYDEGGVHNG